MSSIKIKETKKERNKKQQQQQPEEVKENLKYENAFFILPVKTSSE